MNTTLQDPPVTAGQTAVVNPEASTRTGLLETATSPTFESRQPTVESRPAADSGSASRRAKFFGALASVGVLAALLVTAAFADIGDPIQRQLVVAVAIILLACVPRLAARPSGNPERSVR